MDKTSLTNTLLGTLKLLCSFTIKIFDSCAAISVLLPIFGQQEISVCIVIMLWDGQLGNQGYILGRARDLSLLHNV